MPQDAIGEASTRNRVLDPVDRVSELIFGLLMALSFTGAVSVAEAGRVELRAMFLAALGCNLAWGLVDAVMYLVRVATARGKSLSLVRSVRAAGADAEAGQALIEASLQAQFAGLVSRTEMEAMRQRIVELPDVPARPKLGRDDLLAAVAVFLLVVIATFPVVIPFAVMSDVAAAKSVSRGISLAMLFFCGFTLGRYAGYGGWRAGIKMALLGTLLVIAIHLLGG
ncbi:hypothetical protein QTH91_08525 [Variovorax dokdonensis]|uniref:VIT family protein n=1 Tax=Variovorax dokdonensis TaxID=344883 RepID=A0ABT7N998_9BURK|nr:hypothetical protein [Variovorax dokdonensis]MDM0044521.1 hypothetical protein [Variovorax dokdonensis]